MYQIFMEQFPDIIEIILLYNQFSSDLVNEINKKIQQIVLDIMKDKNDFDNIFKKLKNSNRIAKRQANNNLKDFSKTKEIVVKWYILIF